MSVETLAIVLHHSRATGTAKVILLGIANHDGDGGAWPSIDTLARYANCNHRNAKRHIKALVDLGELRRHIMAGGTRDTPDHLRPNRYDVLVACPPGCDRSPHHRAQEGWERLTDGTFRPVDNRGGDIAPRVDSAPGGGGGSAPLTVPRTTHETGSAYVTVGSDQAAPGTAPAPAGLCSVCANTWAKCQAAQVAWPQADRHDFTPRTDKSNKAAPRLSDAVEEGERSNTPGDKPEVPGAKQAKGNRPATGQEG